MTQRRTGFALFSSYLLVLVSLFASTPAQAQVDRVQEKKLLLLGVEHPLAIDLESEHPVAYLLTFGSSDARAYRIVSLGYEGKAFLLTATPERLGAGGKVDAAIRLEGETKAWRSNMLISLSKAVSTNRQAENEEFATFMLVHTNEAQYLLRTHPEKEPFIIETLGLSHLPTGSLLRTIEGTTYKPSTMIYLAAAGSTSIANEQVYIRRIH